MSTPQPPDGGAQPDPQNPYGPPPTSPPPTAPPASPYGEPTYPQPGQAPYGQQPYPQQPYPQQFGQPAYGAPPPDQDAPKAMAITALVLSFLGCTLLLGVVSVVLAIIVLSRGKDGRNHGKGLAIAAIVISVLSALATIGLIAVGVVVSSSLPALADLKTGQCINASGLRDDSADSVSDISTLSCAKTHDGEVLGLTTLTAEQAPDYFETPSEELCAAALDAAATALLGSGEVGVVALTTSVTPAVGDRVVCIGYATDGSRLTGPLAAPDQS